MEVTKELFIGEAEIGSVTNPKKGTWVARMRIEPGSLLTISWALTMAT